MHPAPGAAIEDRLESFVRTCNKSLWNFCRLLESITLPLDHSRPCSMISCIIIGKSCIRNHREQRLRIHSFIGKFYVFLLPFWSRRTILSISVTYLRHRDRDYLFHSMLKRSSPPRRNELYRATSGVAQTKQDVEQRKEFLEIYANRNIRLVALKIDRRSERFYAIEFIKLLFVIANTNKHTYVVYRISQ